MRKLLNFKFKPVLVLPFLIIFVHGILARVFTGAGFNTGFAFGLNEGRGELNLFVAILLLVAFAILFRKYFYSVGFQLILGGGLANISDRVLLGRVVDYILLTHLLQFNIADICVVSGVVILVLNYFWKEETGSH